MDTFPCIYVNIFQLEYIKTIFVIERLWRGDEKINIFRGGAGIAGSVAMCSRGLTSLTDDLGPEQLFLPVEERAPTPLLRELILKLSIEK